MSWQQIRRRVPNFSADDEMIAEGRHSAFYRKPASSSLVAAIARLSATRTATLFLTKTAKLMPVFGSATGHVQRKSLHLPIEMPSGQLWHAECDNTYAELSLKAHLAS